MSYHPQAIRFRFPASVALNPEGFAGAIESIAEKLGCPRCFSGVNCLFQREMDFVINEKLQALPQDPIPVRELPQIDIAASEKVFMNIDMVKKAAEIVFKDLGCLPCTSGKDILFRNTIRTLTIDENLNVGRFG